VVKIHDQFMYLPFKPKTPLKMFKKGTFFKSKKKPLLILGVPADIDARQGDQNVTGVAEGAPLVKCLFKLGDDLRQDNLVL